MNSGRNEVLGELKQYLFGVHAVALPLWRVYCESFSSSFCSSPRDSCPEMRVISNYVSVILNKANYVAMLYLAYKQHFTLQK